MTDTDPLAGLDFATACMIGNHLTRTDCELPAEWVADIHLHGPTLTRVAVCGRHREAFESIERQLMARGPGRCPVCYVLLGPGDILANVEPI